MNSIKTSKLLRSSYKFLTRRKLKFMSKMETLKKLYDTFEVLII